MDDNELYCEKCGYQIDEEVEEEELSLRLGSYIRNFGMKLLSSVL